MNQELIEKFPLKSYIENGNFGELLRRINDLFAGDDDECELAIELADLVISHLRIVKLKYHEKAKFDYMIEQGKKAWAGVPKASEWVDELRGNKEQGACLGRIVGGINGHVEATDSSNQKKLSFQEVIVGLDIGRKYRREGWDNYVYLQKLLGTNKEPSFIRIFSYKKIGIWEPKTEDLTANDWVQFND